MPAEKLDFAARVNTLEPAASQRGRIRFVMLNVGRRCDLSCNHCHQRSSPSASEAMSEATMERAVRLASSLCVDFVDVTGGAPELWPHLEGLLDLCEVQRIPVRLRTNLVALGEGHFDAEKLLGRDLTLLASLPGTTEDQVRRLRGPGQYRRSLAVLRKLAEMGFGGPDGPALELAWNPSSGLPRLEAELEREFSEVLEPLGVRVARVRAIANVPLGRYADRLKADGAQQAYLHKLADAFDSRALTCLPCRSGIEVGWDGRLFDCDFNLAAGLPVADGPTTVRDALERPEALAGARIAFGPHCFACTVGSGSG